MDHKDNKTAKVAQHNDKSAHSVEKKDVEAIAIKDVIAEKDKIIHDYTDHLKRLQAEFENHIKRTEKEKQNLVISTKANLINKILTVIDGVESAIQHLKHADKKTLEGVELIHKQISKLLEEESVRKIEAVGEPDPYKHEVIMETESNLPEGHIAKEIQKGYAMHDTVLRYAKVAVSKSKNEGGK